MKSAGQWPADHCLHMTPARTCVVAALMSSAPSGPIVISWGESRCGQRSMRSSPTMVERNGSEVPNPSDPARLLVPRRAPRCDVNRRPLLGNANSAVSNRRWVSPPSNSSIGCRTQAKCGIARCGSPKPTPKNDTAAPRGGGAVYGEAGARKGRSAKRQSIDARDDR
jgi:hypothetical protein